MSAQVTITQLPSAGAITGSELVPVVQNGVTVQTTTGAISASPSQTQTFLTVGQQPTLPNSRYIGATNGLTVTDGGAQGLYNISTTGALSSLVGSSAGIQVKTDATTLTNRSIAAGTTGLSVANGSGVSGDPTVSLTGAPLNLANLSANGLLTIQTSGGVGSTSIQGTSNQITVVNGNAVSGAPTVSLADNPVLPGAASTTLPIGATSDRPVTPVNGMLRYNNTLGLFEGYINGAWSSLAAGTGVTSVATGTGLTGGPITSTGTISIDSTVVTLTGTQTLSNKTFTAPALGTPASGVMTNVTGLPLTTGVTGTLPIANGGTNSTTAPTAGAVPYGTGAAYAFTAAGTTGQVLTSAGAGTPTWATPTTGTVSSVSFTGGIISVATATTTPALTVAGTSGGIPYFSSASTWATSAALAANAIVVGGGAGAAPSSITTGTGVVTALGVNTGSAGSFTVNGAAAAFTTISASGVITSTVATGTAPFTVASTTQVANLNAATAGTATNATNTAITANSTNASNYLTFVSATSGNLGQLVNSAITCNPSTGVITGGISGGTF